MNTPNVFICLPGNRCTWCDRKAQGGERWLVDGEEWLYCSARCYASTAENIILNDADTERVRFTDALTVGQKALASAPRTSAESQAYIDGDDRYRSGQPRRCANCEHLLNDCECGLVEVAS